MLTDALILIGQHGVYCASTRNPSKPALDLEAVLGRDRRGERADSVGHGAASAQERAGDRTAAERITTTASRHRLSNALSLVITGMFSACDCAISIRSNGSL